MGGFLGTLWWVVLFFCLFCVNIWGMRCFKNRCYCKEELRLIDCSRANLMVVPNSVPLVNYTALNLRHNSLVQVNFSVLREQLPNLKMVDLRDNPFACKGFPDKTIFGVITDCEMAMTRKTLKTTRLPSSHAGTPTRKTLKTRKLAQPTTTTRLPSSHPWNVYNYLYDCFVFIRFINAGHYPLFERCCKTVQNKTSYQNTSDFLWTKSVQFWRW